MGDQAGDAIRLFCSPYGSASALHPFTAHLKRMAGVERADSEAERHAKLAAAIADAKLPANMAPSLAPLLSLSDEMRAAVAISPAHEFVLWGTKRADWRSSTTIEGDRGYAAAVLDALNIV